MLNIMQAGAGPLGLNVSGFIRNRNDLNLVGVVDLNPELYNKDIGELIDGTPAGVRITGSLDEMLKSVRAQPSVAVITTVSSQSKIIPTIREFAERKMDIVTTCEELAYPWNQRPKESEEINKICRDNGVTCVGTGVNPGFLMDYLPSVLLSVCQHVEYVEVERIQDASIRRVPFQQKIGAGLSHEQYQEEYQKGTLRHVGLPESADMIAAAMNIPCDENHETLEKVVADRTITNGYKPIKKGEPSGVEQITRVISGGRERIKLRFRAAVGEGESYDKVIIRGNPDFESVIPGGINGDVATSAITVNTLRSVYRSEPGLKTMLDIPAPSWFENFRS